MRRKSAYRNIQALRDSPYRLKKKTNETALRDILSRRATGAGLPPYEDNREIDLWESRTWYIYAVPRGAASNAAAGISLEVAEHPFNNVSTVWGATAFLPRMEMVRRCCRSATTTTTTTAATAVISLPFFDMLTTTLNNTARSLKPNHAVSFLLPRLPSPRPPPSSATAIRMILVINIKVWEQSGWWRSHVWRGKKSGRNQVQEVIKIKSNVIVIVGWRRVAPCRVLL